eukprot:RCo051131
MVIPSGLPGPLLQSTATNPPLNLSAPAPAERGTAAPAVGSPTNAEDIPPVFNGPVYALDSAQDLPQPVEIKQVQEVEVDPVTGRRHVVITTTHILPPMFIYSKDAARQITDAAERSGLLDGEAGGHLPGAGQREGEEPEEAILGELFVDRTAPDSLAPWLLLLEAGVAFSVHEVDPQVESVETLGNPSGVLPMWVDADGSNIWGSHAVMRFLCDKHGLPLALYPFDNLNLRGRVNVALDWTRTVLVPHLALVLDPEAYERCDRDDAASGKLLLDKDMKVITKFFLQETPFIGGDAPCIADFSLAMQLLLLYATDYLPPVDVREYLHRCADACEHWNDLTTPLRDFCVAAHLARVRLHTEREQSLLNTSARMQEEELAQAQAEAQAKLLAEQQALDARMAEEKRRLDE